MSVSFVDRNTATDLLNAALTSEWPELVAITGRHRVGKSRLVHHVLGGRLCFELTGWSGATTVELLQHFADQLNQSARPVLPVQRPPDWKTAFQLLIHYLESLDQAVKQTVFLDELPWLVTSKSDFLPSFAQFWNQWAMQRKIVVVLSASSVTWMNRRILQNDDAFYNRVTRKIHLQPFTLAETEAFLHQKGIQLTRLELLQYYMVLGGIPHFFDAIQPQKPFAQQINQLFFLPEASFRQEWPQHYEALIERTGPGMKILQVLSAAWHGLNRSDVLKKTGLADGGNTTQTLEELLLAGWISAYPVYGKKKKALRYRLTDPFTLFYFRFIHEPRFEGPGAWERLMQTQFWPFWQQYAFENVCLLHESAIKKALGMPNADASAFYIDDTQIDLLLEEKGNAMYLILFKLLLSPSLFNRELIEEFKQKKTTFMSESGINRPILNNLLVTAPMTVPAHSAGELHKLLTLNHLFERV